MYLCVDLDKTFLVKDSTRQMLLIALKTISFKKLYTNYRNLGLNQFKEWLFQNIDTAKLDLSNNKSLEQFIYKKINLGYSVYLVTGSSKSICQLVSSKYPYFDKVIHSKPGLKLKGKVKRNLLCQMIGEGNFDYIGDSYKDIYVWLAARNRYAPKKYSFKFFLFNKIIQLKFI